MISVWLLSLDMDIGHYFSRARSRRTAANSILVVLFARFTGNWSCVRKCAFTRSSPQMDKSVSFFIKWEKNDFNSLSVPLFALYLFIIARSVCMTVELVSRLNTSSLPVFNKHKQVGHSAASAHARVRRPFIGHTMAIVRCININIFELRSFMGYFWHSDSNLFQQYYLVLMR